MAKPILIATTTHNTVSGPVVSALRAKYQNVLVIYTDQICDQSKTFEFIITRNSLTLRFGGEQLDLRDIGSAWYWRALVAHASKNLQIKMDVEREMRHTLRGIWDSIDDDRWINPPHRIRETQNKLMQPKFAQIVGLTPVPTIATNNFERVSKHFAHEFIIKMPGLGIIGDTSAPHALYTTVVQTQDYDTHKRASPFPGMIQPFLSKKKEWRVTIVGDKVFSAAIYTNKSAKDDWRLHSHNKEAVRFVAEAFPVPTIKKCKKLLQNLGLRYGAFDFIETENNELFFVEVNTNGQYLWLEKELGFPISETIADELIAIAQA